jgi:hypothetical protein
MFEGIRKDRNKRYFIRTYDLIFQAKDGNTMNEKGCKSKACRKVNVKEFSIIYYIEKRSDREIRKVIHMKTQ